MPVVIELTYFEQYLAVEYNMLRCIQCMLNCRPIDKVTCV